MDLGASGEPPTGKANPIRIPRRRNSFFCGREDTLSLIRDRFRATCRDGIANIQALSGLGGVGKTQIAVEYVYRYRAEYQRVFWVNAASTFTIDSGLVEIASQLNLPGTHAQELSVVANAVMHWLANNHEWLLVLDNADETELIQTLIIGNSRGQYLLTSRQATLDAIGVLRPIPVGVMNDNEATEFLLTRTDRSTVTGEELHAAKKIVKELGRLPLALEQAGSYILSRRASYATYLHAYRQRKLEVLAKSPPMTGEYTETVSTTWSLNLDAVREELTAAAALLNFVAFLHPDEIPYELLPRGAKEMGEGIDTFLQDFFVDHDEQENPTPRIDESLIDDLLYPLARYSLIEKFPEYRTFSIHRLVQEVIKAGISEGETKDRRAKLIKILADAFPIVSFEVWPICSRLLRHAIALVATTDWNLLQSIEAGTLLHRVAHFLEETGECDLSLSVYYKAVEVREAVLGTDDADTGTSINNLGVVLFKMGYFKESEETLRRALVVRSNASGEDHVDVGQTWNNLAMAVGELGKLDESQDCFDKATEILTKESDVYNDTTMTTLCNIAKLMHERGKTRDAEAITRNVLLQREENLGAKHPKVAFTLRNLAVFAIEREATSEGFELIRRAMEIQEGTIGQMHPDYAETCNVYGGLLSQMKKFREAITAHSMAEDIMAHTLGQSHPKFAIVLNNLGHCYQEMGKQQDAIAYYKRAIATLVARVGPEHIDVASILNNLAYCYYCNRDGVNARALYQRVLAIRKNVLGLIHKDVAAVIGSLALIAARIGSSEEALKAFREAASIYADLGDPRIDDCNIFLRHYLSFLKRIKRYAEASKVKARLRAMRES